MRESRAWDWINNHKPTWLAIERIEAVYPPGMADCFWTDVRTSISGWLELKYCEPNNRDWLRGAIPKLRPEQPMFLSRQARKGVPAGILLREGSERWHLWRADKDRTWPNLIRSPAAKTARTATWLFEPTFDVDQIIENLYYPNIFNP